MSSTASTTIGVLRAPGGTGVNSSLCDNVVMFCTIKLRALLIVPQFLPNSSQIHPEFIAICSNGTRGKQVNLSDGILGKPLKRRFGLGGAVEEEGIMREKLEARLQELKTEFGKGERTLQELEEQAATVRQNMLSISGAIQVLEEVLTGEDATRHDGEVTNEGRTTVQAGQSGM